MSTLGFVRFESADLEQLSERGISEAEGVRQLEMLAAPPGYARLERAATLGDGIAKAEDQAGAESAARAAANEGRIVQFVPASGAASRMFRDLLAALAEGRALTRESLAAERAAFVPGADSVAAFVEGLPHLAFRGEIERELQQRGDSFDALLRTGHFRPILQVLLDSGALDFAERPKGLLPFHRSDGEIRTAFEEHLVEAAELSKDHVGVCRLHFTVAESHRAEFEQQLESSRARLESRWDAQFEVGFSVQKRSTDTLAATPEGAPFRDGEGKLLFRPSGHGALIENLADLRADLVFIKNVDNVAVDRLKRETTRWARVLLGEAATLSERAHAALRSLETAGGDRVDALALAREFGHRAPHDASEAEQLGWLREALDRPVRVCGMVPNTGEPGGGPFWVRDARGITLQIVESAQVAPDDARQQELFRRGTHFNPVFLACALRDHRGDPHDLARFVDPAMAIFTRKSHAGRELLALERPGLWNGAMSGWNTRFVEVPLAVFNPVKTVNDLLRPEHQH